ncbi:hypothetical protein E4U42_002082 [Claviceps africana]|uniref:Uncharacterized protein n=1 Tax=Claviceps africana TaxID=83212 RepID=A0A8K0J9Y7_9HYPO|nr:hypothetical protein E4U42_002082 [Claviceps africana]
MGLVASSRAVNTDASKAAGWPPATEWSPYKPTFFAVSDDPGVATRDLVARVPDWTSPHVRRAFIVDLGTQLVTGANWTFDMWIHHDRSFRLWRSEVSGSDNLFQANVVVPAINTISTTTYEWTGKATFQMSGWVREAELVIQFMAEVNASSAFCVIQRMIQFPTAKLAGADIPITSWSFDKVKSGN